jgi:protein-S-isoprenylcysteine O-methyltransferase Ste14
MINETLITAAANCTTVVSALGLLIHIFGDPSNKIWNNSVKAWLAKAGLSITICGATSNVLTLSTPPVTEVVLNVGISITFFWLSWWQWETFKEMQKSRLAQQKVKQKKVAKPRIKRV